MKNRDRFSWLRPVVLGIAFVGSSCGEDINQNSSELRVIGGSEVKYDLNDEIAMGTVALTTDVTINNEPSPLSNGKSFCSGTIIGKRTILTAAHCVQYFDNQTQKKYGLLLGLQKNYLVFFGTKVTAKGTWIRAEKVIPHRDWEPAVSFSPTTMAPANDIAVIVLAEDIPKSAKIIPIGDESLDLSKERVQLAGYGISFSRYIDDTGVLRKISLDKQEVSKERQTISTGEFMRGVCGGDSGGPMYSRIGGKLHVVGAASTGTDFYGLLCLGSGSTYTDARYYKKWISENSPDFK